MFDKRRDVAFAGKLFSKLPRKFNHFIARWGGGSFRRYAYKVGAFAEQNSMRSNNITRPNEPQFDLAIK
jgi:hypothetical protein